MADILLIEDDLSFTRILDGFLSRNGYSIQAVHTLREARKIFPTSSCKLVLLDYHLPDGNGLDWLGEMRASGLTLPVIIMTSFNDVRTAVRAMREGVIDYITKPINPEELLMRVREVLDKKQEDVTPPGQNKEVFIEGVSPAAVEIKKNIALLAPTDMTVLIQGESGTGKENIARSIHRQSQRSSGPFVAIDCGALPEELAGSELFGHVKGAFTGAGSDRSGYFEEARGGTLFLDEIGNMSYAIQVKLLRALQERKIQPVGSNKTIDTDVRVIAATNDDLLQKVNEGLFRKDLYHRLNEFIIHVPPLRQRTPDLEIFIQHFITRANQELNRQVKFFSPGAMKILLAYSWPGNLRELKNIVKRSVLLSQGNIIEEIVLPVEMIAAVAETNTSDTRSLWTMNENNEKELIIKTLEETRYNKSKTAAILNIDRKTLYMKMARYNIKG